MDDHINIRKENYPDTENELEKETDLSEDMLADLDSEDGPITIFSEKSNNENVVFVTIDKTTLHISENSFYVLTKAIQQSAKKLLDL